jgi:hypothetical protein
MLVHTFTNHQGGVWQEDITGIVTVRTPAVLHPSRCTKYTELKTENYGTRKI